MLDFVQFLTRLCRSSKVTQESLLRVSGLGGTLWDAEVSCLQGTRTLQSELLLVGESKPLSSEQAKIASKFLTKRSLLSLTETCLEIKKHC